MKRFINLPCFLLFSLVTKILITGASVGDSISLIALAGLTGYWFYLEEYREAPINEKCKQDIVNLARELETVKAALGSMRLGQHMRGK